MWRATRRAVMASGGVFGDPYSPLADSDVIRLLDPIEPAVPEILTRE